MDPKTKFKLFKQSKNFCAVPWTNFQVFTNGKVETCSRGKTTIGNLHEESIETILQGKTITKIREDMLNDIPNANCVVCQTQSIENDGYHYLKDHYNSKIMFEDVDYSNPHNFDLRFIDLHWSNVCNLRCVMCTPDHSSLIAKDENVDVNLVDPETIKTITNYILDKQDDIKEIYLSGGEPFYIPQNITLFEKLENKDVPVRINTNMHWHKNNKLFKVLQSFNNVQLTMSADATHEKFEYIRTGANWKTFIDNFSYVQSNTNFDIRVNMIFSVINAMDVADNISYWYHGKNIKDLTLNLLSRPEALMSCNYPENKKQNVIDKLIEVRKTIPEHDLNLRSQINYCVDNISQPNKMQYDLCLDSVTKKSKKPWREVFTDL
jgi:organic radical activating enzyme|tara:strand:- start:816 stop:1949 length:1134 start_codon:yes stop_codon:yes gene_type:complete